jgi:hypothetical protein
MPKLTKYVPHIKFHLTIYSCLLFLVINVTPYVFCPPSHIFSFVIGPAVAHSQTTDLPKISKILDNGHPDTHIDLTFIGSGFVHAEIGDYVTKVSGSLNKMLSVNWFNDHKSLFNVWRVDVVSSNSAIDLDDATIHDVASQTPHDILVVLHNYDGQESVKKPYIELFKYSHNYVALAHELGHKIGKLDDEYYTPGVTYKCNYVTLNTLNIHDRPSNEKWSDLISTYPAEGARYCQSRQWRPSEKSIMGNYWEVDSKDFDAVGYKAMDLGAGKILGRIEKTPPTVSVSGVSDGQIVSGTLDIRATTSDPSGVERVEFYLAKSGDPPRSLKIDRTEPYTAALDTTQYENGDYFFDVVAYDTNWNRQVTVLQFTLINSENRILPATDLTYLGAFKLPSHATVAWRGRERGMSHRRNGDPENGYNNHCAAPDDPWDCCTGRETGNCTGDEYSGSLFVLGSSEGIRYAAEINIPTPVVSQNKDQNDLNTADFIQSFTDISGGRQIPYTKPVGDVEYFQRQGSQTTDKLYWTLYKWYAPEPGDQPLAWAEIDFGNLSSAGMWRLSDGEGSYYSSKGYGKYLFEIPSSWADTHANSRYLATGYARAGGSDQSIGPTLYAFAPWDSANLPADLINFPNTQLLKYWPNSGGNTENLMVYAAPNDFWSDGAWLTLGSKKAIIFAGTLASRRWVDRTYHYYYPPQDDCFYGSASFSSGPYAGAILFYDEDDITAVAHGKMQPYDPQPYAVMQLQKYMYHDYTNGCSKHQLMGVGYDRANNLLYIEEDENDGSDDTDIIHVFRISDGKSTPDTTPPTRPTNFRASTASKTAITLSWSPSTDTNGGLAYKIWIQGRPIAVVDETSWIHANPEYYVAPYTYKAQAMDIVSNTSESTLTVSDDTNEPIVFFIKAHHGTKDAFPADEISTPPYATVNQPYSYTPTVKGGTPPYTWSVLAGEFPPGIEINGRTGELYGTPTSTGTLVSTIQIEDANGNIYARIIRFRVVANTCDADSDGYDSHSVACGGTDTDDFDCNVNPGNPKMKPPTNAQIKGNTLSWNSTGTDDLSTYTVYYGPSPGNYTAAVFVGSATEYDISELSGQYFAVTAFNVRGLESTFSHVGSNANTSAPSPPSQLRITNK